MLRWCGGHAGRCGRPSISDVARRSGGVEAGDHHQRRRLAGAARAEQREELAARDLEVDGVDGGGPGVALRETGQGEAPPLDDVGHQMAVRGGGWTARRVIFDGG